MWRARCQRSTAGRPRAMAAGGLASSGPAYSDFSRCCKRRAPVRISLSRRGGRAMILPITLTMTGAATLLNLWLGMRVSQLRTAYRIAIGDGGNDALIARMRAQANYVENTPFFLILLGLTELAIGPRLWLWI